MGTDGAACGVCGHGDELEPLATWRDADGESWWIHPLCAEHYGITTEDAA